MSVRNGNRAFPIVRALGAAVVSRGRGGHVSNVVNGDFSSCIHSCSFDVMLPRRFRGGPASPPTTSFNSLRNGLFRRLLGSRTCRAGFGGRPIVYLDISDDGICRHANGRRPMLKIRCGRSRCSLASSCFRGVNLAIHCFVPTNDITPLTFCFTNSLLDSCASLRLVDTVDAVRAFRGVCHPRVCGTGSATNRICRPDLGCRSCSLARVICSHRRHDRVTIARNGFARSRFVGPCRTVLSR